jgi:hypothetical protein
MLIISFKYVNVGEMATTVKIPDVWDAAPCSLADTEVLTAFIRWTLNKPCTENLV